MVGASCLHYAFFSWLIALVAAGVWLPPSWIRYVALPVLILFVFPAIWPIAYRMLVQRVILGRLLVHPVPKAWDYVFGLREAFWVIAHLKSGKEIGGCYGDRSFTSSYPHGEQIFLEEEWVLGDDGRFIRLVSRTGGVLVAAKEIEWLEFFGRRKITDNGQQRGQAITQGGLPASPAAGRDERVPA